MADAEKRGVIDASWFAENQYASPNSILHVGWQGLALISPAGLPPHDVPLPAVTWQEFVTPIGFCDGTLGFLTATHDWEYRPFFYRIDASWVGQHIYEQDGLPLNVAWGRESDAAPQLVFHSGFLGELFGEVAAIWPQSISPPGFFVSDFGGAVVRPPPLDVSWYGATAYAPSCAPWGRWTRALIADELRVYPNQIASLTISSPHFIYRQIVKPKGFSATEIEESARVVNSSRQLFQLGVGVSAYGFPAIHNLLQIKNAQGFGTTLYGAAYVQGGVKHALPLGFVANAAGVAKVINTTANQYAAPTGITPAQFFAPSVSPRTIRTSSLFAYVSGFPLVQFPPQPRGWQSSTFGYPAVEDKTRRARGEGFDSFVTGYAVVRDRAQKVRHSASAVTSVFGDVAARLKSQRLAVLGFGALETSSFAEVRSTRRYLPAVGLYAGDFGAHEARNKTPSVAPAGWLSLAWGAADVGWRVRSVRPGGMPVPFAQLPAPTMWQTPGLKPAGIAPPALQRPTVWPAVRTMSGLGADVARVGTATVGFAYRVVQAAGQDAYAQGAQRVEHGNRTLLAAGAARDTYGSPWVSFGLRALQPDGITPPIDRSTPMVGGLRFLRPDGFTATRFGARIIPEGQALYPLGFTGVFGLAQASNHTQRLSPYGITTFPQPAQSWGMARVHNLRQYVTQDYIEGSALTPPAWPSWTAIENRNKVMRVSGSAMGRVGAAQVENGARAILTQGAVTPGPSMATMVAYRIRPLTLEGMDAPYIARWSVVANNAAVLKPAGFVVTDFGAAHAESNRRFITRAGAIFSQWFDPPLVAPRVRGVSMDSRYSIAPPIVRLPDVQLLMRYVDADKGGIGAPEVGRASLQIIWRGIIPRWTHRDFFGEPRLHNVTPQLYGRGWVAEEFGTTAVRLEWRPVDVVQGSAMSLFGRTRISDKTQRISLAGSDMARIGDKLKVARIGVQPPSLQTIVVSNANEPQQDFIDLRYQVSKPSLNQQVIYVVQDKPHTLWGDTRADSNGIRVEPGYWDHLIGEPFVSLKHRTLVVEKFPDNEVFTPTKPRLSPHTIWAVNEAPQQAKTNHPVSNLHYVNSDAGNRAPGVVFGRAVATLKHRVIKPDTRDSYSAWWRMGQPSLQNKRRYLGPSGFPAGRFGWHTVPGTRTLVVEDPPVTMVFGHPTVARPPYIGPQTVKPAGLVATAFNRSDVSHRNRALAGTGWASLVMGTRLPSDTPYAWRGLRVGELMPTIPAGFSGESFGRSWVSLRVRDVQPRGEDMFTSEYDYTQFAQRMRVRNAQTNEPPSQRITTSGHQSSACGWQEARPMRHYIRPDGNANQHRKGAPVA